MNNETVSSEAKLINFFKGNFYPQSLQKNNLDHLSYEERERVEEKIRDTIIQAKKVGAGPSTEKYK